MDLKSINILIVIQTRLKLKSCTFIGWWHKEKITEEIKIKKNWRINQTQIPLRDNNTAHQRCKSGHYFNITGLHRDFRRALIHPDKPARKKNKYTRKPGIDREKLPSVQVSKLFFHITNFRRTKVIFNHHRRAIDPSENKTNSQTNIKDQKKLDPSNRKNHARRGRVQRYNHHEAEGGGERPPGGWIYRLREMCGCFAICRFLGLGFPTAWAFREVRRRTVCSNG